MGNFGKYKAAIARNNHSMEVQELQSKIEQLEKKFNSLNLLLANWNDEYTQNTASHETTTDAVLRTCITELDQALRGECD